MTAWTSLVLGQGDATAFWMRRGFSEVLRAAVLKLDLAGADLRAAAPPVGVRLVTLAEHGDIDDAVYAVACDAIADSPGADRAPYETGDFDHWRTAEFRSPGAIEDCTIIALAAGDMVVGCAILSRDADSDRLDLERRGDVDGRHQGPGHRAELGVGAQDALDSCAFVGVLELEVVGHVDALEDQDLVLFLDLALGDSDEPITA